MKSKVCFLVVLALLVTCLLAGSALAATIGLRAADPAIYDPIGGYIEVGVCETFQVELYIEGIPEDLATNVEGAEGIVQAAITIGWDPLVAFEDAAKVYSDPEFGWQNMSFTPAPASGLVPDAVDVYADIGFGIPPIAEDHVIAELTLHCVGAGWTELILGPTIPVPFNITLDDGRYLDDFVTWEGITIHQTPIPSTVLLLGGGLVGLISIGRRRMRKS